MPTLFEKIVSREIPAYILAEDEQFLAFLDVFPLAAGHTLVIPKLAVDYVFDLSPELLSGLFLFAQKIAPALEKVIPCKKIGMAVIGLEVPHAHLHLVPLQKVGDLDFGKAKLQMSPQELQKIQRDILKHL